MKVAIMQPYFLPYIGYFQLMGAVDTFVVYDNIKYTKKGWINRNRILVNGHDETITLPLKQDSDYLNIDQRFMAATAAEEKARIIRKIQACYRKAPYYSEVFPFISDVINHPEENLFRYLFHLLQMVSGWLGLHPRFVISSSLPVDPALRAQDRVLATCQALGADTYLNPIGGIELYAKDVFRDHGVELHFIRSNPFEYPQFGETFVPWLSIVDVMMFYPLNAIRNGIGTNYDLI